MRQIYMIDLCQAQIIKNAHGARLEKREVRMSPEEETVAELIMGGIALAVVYGLLAVIALVNP